MVVEAVVMVAVVVMVMRGSNEGGNDRDGNDINDYRDCHLKNIWNSLHSFQSLLTHVTSF